MTSSTSVASLFYNNLHITSHHITSYHITSYHITSHHIISLLSHRSPAGVPPSLGFLLELRGAAFRSYRCFAVLTMLGTLPSKYQFHINSNISRPFFCLSKEVFESWFDYSWSLKKNLCYYI